MKTYSTPLRSKFSLYKRLHDPKFRRAFVSSRIAQTTATQVRVMRQKREMSQQQLARELGTSQNAIYRLENPSSTKPNISTLERVADFFGVGLIVRFAPFSEMVDWALNLSARALDVPRFEDDHGFTQEQPPRPIVDWPNFMAAPLQNGTVSACDPSVGQVPCPTYTTAWMQAETPWKKGPHRAVTTGQQLQQSGMDYTIDTVSVGSLRNG